MNKKNKKKNKLNRLIQNQKENPQRAYEFENETESKQQSGIRTPDMRSK